MKVVSALCGLAMLLQAARIDAQDSGAWTNAVTPPDETLNGAGTLEEVMEPTIIEAPTIEEIPTPSWEDLHPPGWNGDGRPPEYWDVSDPEYVGGLFGPNPYEPEPIPYEPSWEELYPPGWNGDGRPDGYWDTYWGEIPDTPRGGEGDGVPPWLLGGDVPQPVGITGDYDLPLWLMAEVLGTEVYIPTAATIPGFTAVDTDGDHVASSSEWSMYSQKLQNVATSRTANARDAKGKALLNAIIAFHYDNLNACIERNAPSAVSKDDYERVATELATKCNLKFRYSLLAGPAPFEWIAHKEPTISSAKFTTWFATQLASAIDDIKNERVRPELEAVLPFAKDTLMCLSRILSSQETKSLDRDAYYKVVDAALACGESESH